MFTAHKEVEELAKKVLAEYKRITQDAEAALSQLDEDAEDLKEETIEARKQAIYDGVRDQYAKARLTYGKQIDAAVREINRLSDSVKPAKTTNAAVASILSVLEIAPAVNQMMLESAAANIGGDAFGQDTLRQIAQRHGLTMPYMEPVEKHLRSSDIANVADDLTAAFKRYFDSYSEFIPERAQGGTQQNTPEREITMTRGIRSNAEYTLECIGNGNAFQFGDPVMQTEFTSLIDGAN